MPLKKITTSLLILGALLPAVLTLLTQPSTAQQYRSGQQVKVRWVVNSKELWIPATVTETRGSVTCAKFSAAEAGMYSSSGVMNECFEHFFIRSAEPENTANNNAAEPQQPKPQQPQRNNPPVANTPAKPNPAPANPGGMKFKVGEKVITPCWGADEEAVVTGYENGKYKLKFNVTHCGDSREEKQLRPAKKPAQAPAVNKPLPGKLPAGTYKCFASVPRYAGSHYVTGVGSVPNYTFSWNLQGTLNILANGTYQSGGGGAAKYTYNPATGQINWQGGFHNGIPSSYAYTKEGKGEILINRKDGKVGTWHCSR